MGVGTTSPNSKLHVHTDSSGASQIRLSNSFTNSATTDGFLFGYPGSSNDILFQNREAGALRFLTADTEYMRITSTGLIGIGTTSPASNLAVVGDVLASSFTATSTTATSTFQLADIFDGTFGSSEFYPDSGAVTWIDMPVSSTVATGTVQSYTARLDGSSAITVYGTADGSGGIENLGVGIGSTTPMRALSVNGTTTATCFALNSSPDDCINGSGTVNSGTIYQNAYYAANGTAVSGTSTMITRDEKVGIGSTTPATKLSVGSGAFLVAEQTPATSTSMTVDWSEGNQQVIRKGTAAIAVSFSNNQPGQALSLTVCNPPTGTGGALTFSGVLWPGGTAPTLTTTAGVCDYVTFRSTVATSSNVIFGGYNLDYN